MFFTNIMTLYLTPPQAESPSIFQLQLGVFPPLSFCPTSLAISSIDPRLQLQPDILFSFLTPYALSNPPFTPHTSHTSLYHTVSHALRFFLFFFFLCLLLPLGMYRHAQESRAVRTEGGLMAVSDSTADRWEGLPGVKVQSWGNTTPPALVLGDLCI